MPMADVKRDNKILKQKNQSVVTGSPSEVALPKTEQVKEPTLADDLIKLQQIKLLRAVTIRAQSGKYPDTEIDDLLKRHMNFANNEVQGPFAVRLVCTFMFIFIFGAMTWGIIWTIATIFEFNYFLRLMSTGIMTLMAAVAGIAIFHPLSLPDDKKLKIAIENRMEELKAQIAQNSAPTKNESNEKNSTGNSEKKQSEQQASEQAPPKISKSEKKATINNNEQEKTSKRDNKNTEEKISET